MDFLNWLAQYRTPVGDFIFQNITIIAQQLVVVAILCWLFWCGNKNLAYKLGFGYFLSGLTIQGLKIAFRIPRPWVLDPSFKPVESAVPAATGYSFPSGHTQSGTALFTTLASQTKRWYLRLSCVIAFFLIGFSRMYLGVHTPADVFTSMSLTFVITCLACYGWKSIENDHKYDLLMAIVLTLLTFSLLVYDYYLVKTDVISMAKSLDCSKACGAGLAFAWGFYFERRFINFTVPDTMLGKLLRFIAGLLGVLVITYGIKAFFPSNMVTAYIRYFLMVFWVLTIYPLIFSRIQRN